MYPLLAVPVLCPGTASLAQLARPKAHNVACGDLIHMYHMK